jgi:hypothetical protein
MTASEHNDRQLRVDNGLTVVPIADVHANDGLRRTLSAAVGQERTLAYFPQSRPSQRESIFRAGESVA